MISTTHPHPIQLVANILLGEGVVPNVGAIFAHSLPSGAQIFSQDETHLFAKIQGPQAAPGMDGLEIALAFVPLPVAFDGDALERTVRSNLLTQSLPLDPVAGHKSHIKIILKAPTDALHMDTQAMAKALMGLTVVGCAGLNALAVHWQSANSVQNAQIFKGIAPHLPNLPPLSQTTLAVRVFMFQPNQHTITTEGLAVHTGYEIGMDVPARLDHALLRDLLALADHCITAKPDLKDGETLAVGNGANGLSWRIAKRTFHGKTFFCLVSGA